MKKLDTFPIMCPPWDKRYENLKNCPKSVPWNFVLPHDYQAHRNHSQSLQRLSERGGLCPIELIAVLENRKYKLIPAQDAVDAINKALLSYKIIKNTVDKDAIFERAKCNVEICEQGDAARLP